MFVNSKTIRGSSTIRPLGWMGGLALASLVVAILFASLFFSRKIATQRIAAVSGSSAKMFNWRPFPATSDASPNNGKASTRYLFPYSIVPGGVANAQELKNAIANDPGVASHYADFDVAKAHVIHLDRDRMVFVSYRLGANIYWTQKRLRLPKGETLITDGSHEARTRCGNRLSEALVAPASPQEPRVEAMEAEQNPDLLATSDFPMDGLFAVNLQPFNARAILPLGTLPEPVEMSPTGLVGSPSQSPIVGGGSTYPLSGPGGLSASPLPPSALTPEPETLTLFITGLGIFLPIGWLARPRRKK